METQTVLIKITVLVLIYFLGLYLINHFRLPKALSAVISLVTIISVIKISAPLYKE